MKKFISLFIAILMCVSLAACRGDKNGNKKSDTENAAVTTKDSNAKNDGEENKPKTFTVTLEDGSTEEMTHDELSDLGDNTLKLEDYLGAEVTGTGTVASISEAPNGTATIQVDFMDFEIQNVPLNVAKSFDKGDTIDVKGTLFKVFGCIVYLNGSGYY